MSLSESIAESLVWPVLKTAIVGFAYLTGAVLVKVVTVGLVHLAPLGTLQETNPMPKGKRDWSIWLHRSGKRSALKADWVCVMGVLVWIVAGVCIYQASGREAPEKPAMPAVVG